MKYPTLYVERSLMVGQKFVALCVWVRFPSFNQNTRMAELAYAVVLEAIQL